MFTGVLQQHFDTLVDTPEAVIKLRRHVLNLAVRGRLVAPATKPEQDPAWIEFSDNQRRSDQTSGPAQPLFDTPGHWCWASLEEVAESCGQKKPDARFTYVDVGAIDNERGLIKPDLEVLAAEDAPSRARKLVTPGSVIYSTVRPYLRNIAVIGREFRPPAIVSTAFAVLHPKPFLDSRYLFQWLRSQPFQQQVQARMKGVAYPAISDSEFWQCPIPLPPPEEQRRIVAKVEELLALCDELEARQTAAREHRSRLVRSALDHLTQPRSRRHQSAPTGRGEAQRGLTSAATAEASAAFVLNAFPDLTATPEDVPALRQAILSLAVQGRLVPQNPKDEPAGVLLRAIASDRSKEAREHRILPSSEPHRAAFAPFELPNGWEWVRVQDVGKPRATITYGILKPVWVEHGVPTVRVQDMQNGEILLGGLGHCSYERAKKFCKTSLEKEDLLIAKDGATLGKTAFVPPSLVGGNITQHVLRFPISQRVFRFFVRLVIDSPHGQAWMRAATLGVALPGVNVGDFRRMPIPLPPLPEQHRIVAKVEELMRWCDALETRLTAAQTTATHFLDATLHQLLAA